MAHARGLVHAGAGLEQDLADPVVVEPDPARENIDQLPVEGVPVPAGTAVIAAWLGAIHGAANPATGRRLDAEVAGLEEGTQALALERSVPR